jgi:arylformamidase
MTSIDYNAQFNNRALVPEHPAILARWATDAAQARKRGSSVLDLAYGNDPAERLDLFSARGRKTPLLVFIHGGWWRSLDKSDFSWVAPAYVEGGVSVALLNYGLCPRVSIEDITRQCLRAVTWLRDRAGRYGFDADRIVVAGHSAGGHLAAMMLAAQWPQWRADLPADVVKGAVAVSGVFELGPLLQTPFLNVDLRLDERAVAKLSPARMSPATVAPLITAVGELESAAFHEQNRLIGQAWADVLRADVPLPGANHFTACDALARSGHPLFEATLALCRS